jgi:C4-dicarboxylate transporter DctM subunit
VLGGIYLGVFTATEAAGTGTIYALLIAALIYRTLTWRDMLQGVQEATRTSAMLLMIIAGAAIYGYMLTKLQVPQELTKLVADYGLSRTGFLIAMMVLLFLLGLVLESFSIILLTMPAILPLLAELGIDKVWYGILLTLSLEMALISPPVALNLVVIKAITGAPLAEVNRSILPYMLMLGFGTALLIAFPASRYGCRGSPAMAARAWSGRPRQGGGWADHEPAANFRSPDGFAGDHREFPT